MVFKITSQNRTALSEPKSYRWVSIFMLVLGLFLGNGTDLLAQPTFTQCDATTVTLQPGGADLVLNNITIPANLNVTAVTSGGPVVFTASLPSLVCGDIGGGPVSLTITATDDNGSTNCAMNVMVLDGGPFALCAPLTVQLTGGTAIVTAAQLDGGSTACTAVTATGISIDGGATFPPAQAFNCFSPGSVPAILQVTDNGGRMATCMTTITIQDQAPSASCMGTTVMLDASGNGSININDINNGSTTGACGGGGLSLSRTAFSCTDVGNQTVTLTATNATGQTSTCTATVVVQDNMPPTANCNPISVTLNTNGTYTLNAADLAAISSGSTDNCLGTLNVSVSPNTFSCTDVGMGGPVAVTVTVTSGGSSDMCATTVTVLDNTNPVLVGCPTGNIAIGTSAGGTGDCFGVPTFTGPTVTEACSPSLAIAYAAGVPAPTDPLPTGGAVMGGTANAASFPVGQTIVTYTAMDASGNPATCSFTVTVTDDEVPTITNCPTSITVNVDPNECDNTISYIPPTGNDNCGGGNLIPIILVSNPNVFLNNSTGTLGNPSGVDFADFPVGVTTIRYGFRDQNGNQVAPADQCVVTVTIVDNIPPTIVCPTNQTLDFGACDPSATIVPNFIGLSSVTDNCPNTTVTQTPAPNTPITAIPGFIPADGASFVVTIEVSDSETSDNCTFIVSLSDTADPVPAVNPLPTLTFDCGDANVPAPTALDACGNTIFGVPNQGVPGLTQGPAPTMNPPITFAPAMPPFISDSNPGGVTLVSFTVSGLDPILTGLEIDLLDISHTWVGDLNVQLIAPDMTTVNVFDRIGSNSSGFGCGADDISTSFSDNAASSATDFDDTCINGMSGNFQPLDPFSDFNGINPNGVWQLQITDFVGGDQGFFNSITLSIETLGSLSVPTYDFAATNNYTVQWTYDDLNGNITNQLQQINVGTDSELPVLTSCQDVVVMLDENGVASITPGTFAGESLTLTSGDDFFGCFFGCPQEDTEFCITAPAATTLQFTWEYESLNSNAFFDPFGYSINGVVTTLASGDPALISDPASLQQSGTATISLSPGDVFCLVQTTIDGSFGGSQTTITNFSPGFTSGAYAAGNWSSNEGSLTLGGSIDYNEPDGATDNCEVDFSTLSITGPTTFTCADVGITTITISVADVNGNIGTCFSNVEVRDGIAPTLFNVPTLTDVVGCTVGSDTTGLNVYATDNCGTPSIVYNSSTTQTNNPNFCRTYNYDVTHTWTAQDAMGNTSSASYNIQVQDKDAPVFSASLPTSTTISADQSCQGIATINITDSNLTDNCAPFSSLDVTYEVDLDNDNIPNSTGTGSAVLVLPLGTHRIAYTAVDPCANISVVYTQIITVIDNTPPIASCNGGPFTIGIPASGSITIPASLVDNNSFDNCHAVTTTVTRPGGLPAVFDCTEADGTTAYPITLTVTDVVTGTSSTCTSSVIIQDNVVPIIRCRDITVSLDDNGMAMITPAMIDNGSFDACFGLDASSLALNISTFDINDFGPNTVTLTGSDLVGNTASCTATVTVIPPPTCFNVGQRTGGAGQVVSVPVSVFDFRSVRSFQFTLEISNAPVGEFVGVSDIHPMLSNLFIPQLIITDSFISNLDTMVFMDVMGMDSLVIDTTYTDNFDQIAISWQQLAGGPVSLGNNDIAFYVDILLTGNLGDFSTVVDIASAMNTPKEIVYEYDDGGSPLFIQEIPCFNPNNIPGAVGINELIITGDIYTENNVPVNLVDVDLINIGTFFPSVVASDQTEPDGMYKLVINSTSDYRIVPSKDYVSIMGGVDQNWSNGIDILDVSNIQRHAVGNQFVNSAYKKIAADVFQDGLITTFDAVKLNAYLNTGLTGTPPDSNKSWRFVDAKQVLDNDPNAIVPTFKETITILNIITDSLDNDFIGVKIGDIAGNVADPIRSDDALTFVAKDQAIVAGETITIELSAKDFDALIGYQWILDFDPSVLNYVGMQNANLNNLGEANFGTALLDQGQLVMTWYNATATTMKSDEALFTLKFEALQDASQLSDHISRTMLPQFAAVAYDSDELQKDVNLEFIGATAKDYVLHQNQPNPFKKETVIGFDLPAAAEGTLSIMDVSGRIIKAYKESFTKGYNAITVSSSDLPAVGVLYYQLTTGDFTATKKMIVIDQD